MKESDIDIWLREAVSSKANLKQALRSILLALPVTVFSSTLIDVAREVVFEYSDQRPDLQNIEYKDLQ